ncbi:MAG: hypothetical protein QMB55_06125 [Propionivibrio sp.]
MKPRLPARQRGASLLLALFIAITLALAFSFRLGGNEAANRQLRTLEVLAQARAALIGAAAAPPNTGGLGLLPLPDLGSVRNSIAEEGRDAGNFTGNAKNLSVIGRLPWRTLGIAPLRDVDGECLWYAVSGSAQTAQAPDTFNWDSIGHFELFASDGTATGTRSLTTDPHTLPLALVIAPGAPLSGQNRAAGADVVKECGGNYDAANYLDPAAADPRLNNIINYFSNSENHATGDASASPKPLVTGSVDAVSGNNRTTLANDLVLPITAKDIFDVAKQRQDFRDDLNALIEALVNGFLNTQPPATLPVASANGKGFDAVYDACKNTNCNIKSNSRQWALLNQWRDNFLYAGGPTGSYTVNGQSGCKAVLIFAGERTAVQQRAAAAQKSDPAMYLESANATRFPANGIYVGALEYSAAASSTDIVRCIVGAGAAQTSLAADYNRFQIPLASPSGAVNVIAPNASASPSVSFAPAQGNTGGCLWSPLRIPLAGKTLRAYYEYQFAYPDASTLNDSLPKRGYGFTLQFVRGDLPDASGALSAPTTCGRYDNLGILRTSDLWGSLSYIVETDISPTSDNKDPAGNHIGILNDGSLTHPAKPTTACDGSSTGCAPSPANTFEESPQPLVHKQRIEIHTGCNDTCTQCVPALAGSSVYTNARVSTWLDCTACADVSRDFVGNELIFTPANRDLSSVGNWQAPSWVFTPGAFTYTGGGVATLPNSALTAPASSGRTYRVQLGLRTDHAGTFSIRFGNRTAALRLSEGSESHVLYLDARGNGALALLPDAAWRGALTSASISTANLPSARRCLPLPSEMNSVFFGLTGGFTSAPAEQGATVRTLYLRSD